MSKFWGAAQETHDFMVNWNAGNSPKMECVQTPASRLNYLQLIRISWIFRGAQCTSAGFDLCKSFAQFAHIVLCQSAYVASLDNHNIEHLFPTASNR